MDKRFPTERSGFGVLLSAHTDGRLRPFRLATGALMQRRAAGFSMVEVTIATALVAIIMTLAFPSFQKFTLRAHRVEAISNLLQAAGCQERVRAAAGLYDTGKCLPAESDRYTYRYEPADVSAAPGFSVYAEPRLAQTGDRCGWLTLDHDGRRDVGDPGASITGCWTGRQ